ncbi:signal peptidase I [Acidocella sp.]|uniref:signal peptidase I n=1 Tax=Acidocella sp. TaxID=50710 RepID=UPI002616E254|nr:signal peptidase I [Acidocella sp.]
MARQGEKAGFGELVKTLFWAAVIATGIHSFLFEPFYIPSGSMVPTLLVGDYLVVDKFAYGYSRFSFPFAPDLFSGRIGGHLPKRGDVVVFRPPGQMDEDFIKRIIGLPGDTVQVTNGQLLINGQPVPEADAGTYVDDSSGQPMTGRAYTETLPGGRVHTIFRLPGTNGDFANNTPVYTVPPGDYFMMGDSRDNSEDSRFMDGPVGFVPAENLIGPAEMIFFSIDLRHPFWEVWYWPFEIRWGRMLHGIS